MSAIAAKGGVANDPILVSSAFDSGNIVFDGIEESTGTILCRIGPEPFTEGTDKKQHLQWFHFRVSNVAAKTVSVSISNAGQSSYPSGWPNYKVCASYDKESWFRCQNTKYDAACGHLNWSINIPEGQGTIWFAYFAPYSYERHQALVGRCSSSPFAQLRVIGSTLDGRDIDMLVVGNGPKKFFITARQHPGESMAEWCCEGFLDRLLDENDAMAKMLRSKATFFVVPNANPDGSVRGHLRTNACGANLNREWAPTGDYTAPSLERSPEIYHIMRVLDEQGCDGFLDIHGDEEIEVRLRIYFYMHDEQHTATATPMLGKRQLHAA